MTVEHSTMKSFAPSADTAHPRSPRGRAGAGRLWAWAPALLLGGLLGAQLVVLSQVLHDPGFALERDYYRKAVGWDLERARELQSRALGWRTTCEVTGAQRDLLRVTLDDAQGTPVTGAEVRVEAFHNARAADVSTVLAREVAPGRYEGALNGRRSGSWELRVHARRGGAAYVRVVRQDLSLGDGS